MARMSVSEWEWGKLAGRAHYDANALAKLLHLSVRQLQRQFRRQLNRSPQDWLYDQRIKEAKQLLLSGQSVKAVALELGFRQSSHFCRRFKSQTSMTPSQFTTQNPAAHPCRPQIIN